MTGDPVDASGLAKTIELAEAIEALRAELSRAMNAAPAEGVRFELGPIELKVEAAVTKAGGAKGGVKWLLFEAGGEASYSSVRTQSLTLTLQPARFKTNPQTGESERIPGDLVVSDDDEWTQAPGSTTVHRSDGEPE